MVRVKKSKSLAKEPNSKVPHLALPLRLGSEGHHAMLPSYQMVVFHTFVRFRQA